MVQYIKDMQSSVGLPGKRLPKNLHCTLQVVCVISLPVALVRHPVLVHDNAPYVQLRKCLPFVGLREKLSTLILTGTAKIMEYFYPLWVQ